VEQQCSDRNQDAASDLSVNRDVEDDDEWFVTASLCTIATVKRYVLLHSYLISRFSYIENSLHFNLAYFPVADILCR